MDEVLIPIAGIFMIIVISVGPAWLKSRERREMQATLRAAIDKGQPLPPDVIEALSRETIKAPATASRDLRIGVILLAVSIGVALFGYAFTLMGLDGPARAAYPIMGMAAVPAMIGLAFIVLSIFNKNKD